MGCRKGESYSGERLWHQVVQRDFQYFLDACSKQQMTNCRFPLSPCMQSRDAVEQTALEQD